MLGWRGRYGYIGPATILMPMEFQGLLPDGVGVIAASLGIRSVEDDEIERGRTRIEETVVQMAAEGARAITISGPLLAIRLGYEGDEAARQALSEKAGVPIISGIAAVVAGIKHLGAKQPAVAVALPPEHHGMALDFLRGGGLEPVGISGAGVRGPIAQSQMDPNVFYGLARTLVDQHPNADSIYLGGRVVGLEVATALEADLGLPVVYADQAGLWWALRHLKVAPRPDSPTRLLNC
jgi:maleate cis-trans isomerase